MRISHKDGEPPAAVMEAPATGSDTLSNIRAVVRATNEFFLRTIDTMTVGQHDNMITALIFTAIWTANVRHITQGGENTLYGGIDDVPPDGIRRPVSVMAVANSLRMPYETVRRHAQALIEAGECVRVDKRGLVVPSAVFDKPKYRVAIRDGYPLLLKFLSDLKVCAFDFAPYRRVLPQTVTAPPPGALPANMRAILRPAMELLLRGVDLLGHAHNDDFLRAVVFSAVWSANVRHLANSGEALEYGGLDALPPDEVRRPVTVSTIAATLHLPYETTRRYVQKLVADGLLTRTANKELVARREQLATPEHFTTVRQTSANVVRFLSDMHRAGFDFQKY
jgi:hypothetical protein